MKKIVNVNRNGFECDPEFANNGGSYAQGTVSIDFDDGAHLDVEDTSCGEYGSRIMYTLNLPDSKRICAYCGSMLDTESRYTEFSETHVEYLCEVFQKVGYYIPFEVDAN